MAGSGSASGFSAAQFREAITFAMRMGAAPSPTHRLTFRWSDKDVFTRPDPATRPYNWADTPSTINHVGDMQVDCAFEFAGAGISSESGTRIGAFDETRIIVTLLDTAYNTLLSHGNGRFPDVILADNSTYDIQFIPPPYGLFDVTVWQVHARARDET